MERNCQVCKQCNHKGRPSVTKYSLYCDKNFIGIKKTVKSSLFRSILSRLSKLNEIKDRMFNRRFDEKKGMNTKGFRKRYFED